MPGKKPPQLHLGHVGGVDHSPYQPASSLPREPSGRDDSSTSHTKEVYLQKSTGWANLLTAKEEAFEETIAKAGLKTL